MWIHDKALLQALWTSEHNDGMIERRELQSLCTLNAAPLRSAHLQIIATLQVTEGNSQEICQHNRPGIACRHRQSQRKETADNDGKHEVITHQQVNASTRRKQPLLHLLSLHAELMTFHAWLCLLLVHTS